MSLGRIVVKRIALGLIAAWGVLTTVFLLFTTTQDWVLARQVGFLKWGGADEEAVQAARDEYLAARGLDRPLWQQYVDWMGDMVTLHWRESFETGEAVLPLVAEAAARTAMYVVPAVVLGFVIGLLVGLYAAMRPEGRLAGTTLGFAYLLFAAPAFLVGGLLDAFAYWEVIPEPPFVFDHLLPIALTTTALLGGYVSYTRANALEYTSADFVKLVRAKGASERQISAHVLRNAAIPVFSMLFAEALGLLVLTVFVVEFVFGIDGLGRLLFYAVEDRDLPVLMGGSIVIIGVGVVGNIVQDVSYTMLDPRVDTGRR